LKRNPHPSGPWPLSKKRVMTKNEILPADNEESSKTSKIFDPEFHRCLRGILPGNGQKRSTAGRFSSVAEKERWEEMNREQWEEKELERRLDRENEQRMIALTNSPKHDWLRKFSWKMVKWVIVFVVIGILVIWQILLIDYFYR